MKRLLVIMSMLLIISGCGNTVKQTQTEIEYGKEYAIEELFKTSNKSLELSFDGKDSLIPDKLGGLNIELSIKNKIDTETISYTFNVVDKTGPEIKQIKDRIPANTELNLSDYFTVTDNTDPEPIIELDEEKSTLDITKEGDYMIHLIALDEHLNMTEQDFPITVIPAGYIAEKNITQEMTSKYADEDINVEVTFIDQWIADRTTPEDPQRYFYSFYTAKESSTYVIDKFEVKNTGTKTLTEQELKNISGKDCSVGLLAGNKAEYGGFIVKDIVDESEKHDLTTDITLEPDETGTFYAVYSIPKDEQELDMKANVCLGDRKVEFNN